MRKLALIAATAGSLAVSAVAAPAGARGGFGPGLAGGLIAGAVRICGIASNAYGYGPYGYYGGYGPRYYGGYAPVYDWRWRTRLTTATAIGGCIVQPMLTMVDRVYYGGWHRGWGYGW